MLGVIDTECHKEARYTECRYAECRYAECRGAPVATASILCTGFHVSLFLQL
jgi:hypothetical protein